MPRPLRAEVFTHDEVCVVHCVQRCVRRTFLCGMDKTSGRDFLYRREWIRERMEKLASVFGIDVLSYAIMSNHLHVILRNRPDIVQQWSDHEAALRWLQIFPGKQIDQHLGDPTTTDVEALVANKERLALVRTRLSDISWFMRALCEPIARMANHEENMTGAFWEGRYKAQRILDEAGLLACSMYVDLNPVRAAMAETPETSQYTSAYDRIHSDKGATIASSAAAMKTINREEAGKILRTSTPQDLVKRRREARQRKGPRVRRDAWLAELTIPERSSKDALKPHRDGLRASDKGFLAMSREDYLALLDWTGRKKRPDKQGAIPENLQPILERLGIASNMWSDLVWNYQRYYGKSSGAGKPQSMRQHASHNSRSHLSGQRKASKCFV
jgi:hypothetical protein